MTPHTVTIYNLYNNGQSYKKTIIDGCKFSPISGITIGTKQVNTDDYGVLLVYEDNLVMKDYVKPLEYKGVGFTFDNNTLVVIGEGPDIIRVSDLKGYEHYTITGVNHQNYSYILPHHYRITVK